MTTILIIAAVIAFSILVLMFILWRDTRKRFPVNKMFRAEQHKRASKWGYADAFDDDYDYGRS